MLAGFLSAGSAAVVWRERLCPATSQGRPPDDLQSMVHLRLDADCFDLEGRVSLPFGPERKEPLLKVAEAFGVIESSCQFPKTLVIDWV
jgi:hypothetical protein